MKNTIHIDQWFSLDLLYRRILDSDLFHTYGKGKPTIHELENAVSFPVGNEILVGKKGTTVNASVVGDIETALCLCEETPDDTDDSTFQKPTLLYKFSKENGERRIYIAIQGFHKLYHLCNLNRRSSTTLSQATKRMLGL